MSNIASNEWKKGKSRATALPKPPLKVEKRVDGLHKDRRECWKVWAGDPRIWDLGRDGMVQAEAVSNLLSRNFKRRILNIVIYPTS